MSGEMLSNLEGIAVNTAAFLLWSTFGLVLLRLPTYLVVRLTRTNVLVRVNYRHWLASVLICQGLYFLYLALTQHALPGIISRGEIAGLLRTWLGLAVAVNGFAWLFFAARKAVVIQQ